MIFEKDDRGQVVGYSGLMFDMIDEIGRKLNFTYIVVPPADGNWGLKVNGEWNGMIRQVTTRSKLIDCPFCPTE